MPIEAETSAPSAGEVSIGAAYLAQARTTLAGAHKKIVHCLAFTSPGCGSKMHTGFNGRRPATSRARPADAALTKIEELRRCNGQPLFLVSERSAPVPVRSRRR